MALWLYQLKIFVLLYTTLLTYDLSFDIFKTQIFFYYKSFFATKNHFSLSVNMLFQLYYFYPFLTPLYTIFSIYWQSNFIYENDRKKNQQKKLPLEMKYFLTNRVWILWENFQLLSIDAAILAGWLAVAAILHCHWLVFIQYNPSYHHRTPLKKL